LHQHRTDDSCLPRLSRLVNLSAGVLMVLGGISQFFEHAGSVMVQSIIVGVYLIIFGLATSLLEFQIPPQVSRYASFMFSFVGRGLFYLFIGSIVLGNAWYKNLAGGLVMLVGIGYVVFEFIPSIEPPANMRDADAGWGAEQV